MAANKFATMLHRNSNKMTLVLVYAVLEWTLIILLLLNSLFSYLIIKFAEYFGLKPPCLWCARLDRFFEPQKKNSHKDLLCELHSKEVSKLGFCSNHRKLSESQDMCKDCLSSKPGFREEPKSFSFSQVKQIGVIQSDEGDDEVKLQCSCCGVSFKRKCFDDSSYYVIHPSWDILEYAQKGNSIAEIMDDDQVEEKSLPDDRIRLDLMTDQVEENQEIQSKGENQMVSGVNNDRRGVEETGETEIELGLEIKEDDSNIMRDSSSFEQDLIQFGKGEDSTPEVNRQDLEFFFDYSGNQLVPIELVDSTTEENQNISEVDEDQEFGDYQKAQVHSESQTETVTESAKETEEFLSVRHQNTEQSDNVDENGEELLSTCEKTEVSSQFLELDSMELEETENSLVFHAKEFDFTNGKVAIPQATQTPLIDTEELQDNAVATEEEDSDSDIHSVHDEVSQMQVTDNEEAEVSIGTEIPALDSCDEMKAQDNFSLYSFSHEEPSTNNDLNLNSGNDYEKDEKEEKEEQEGTGELKNLKVEISENLNEMEEERIPDTPTSVDSLNQLHKKLLMLERKESGAEESIDGSVISEIDGGDPISTAEKLKSALKAERKALHALYAELEEERSASAVAANQTMAMINRLQEEKAAMQMEALQYQRMMEEQSEYDQEALQLLNELMMKREREKQELEKELELYRKKVLDYEEKDRMRFLRSKDGSAKSGTCSASCSHSEDGDGMSLDLNHEQKEEGSFDGIQESQDHGTPIDAVLNLESSLADFEEERLSILEQLKVLEEKLVTLSDEEDQHFEDIRPIEDYYEENGRHLNGNYNFDGHEANGLENGFLKEMNGNCHEDRRTMGPTGKRLLPLFDAISTESEDGMIVSNGKENGFHSNKLENAAVTRFELEKKRIDIEEEVDQLYGRLQALEADREFLKHCIGSLKKGDKGTELLQEILQHLRDLRNVDLRARNFTDGALV